jgi:hypothetical protein
MMIRRLMLLAALLLAAPLAMAQGVLSAGFAGTHGSRGAYIDISATSALNVTGFAMNLQTGPVTVTVYTKSGTTAGSEATSGAWTLWTTVNVTGKGQGSGTGVAIPPFAIGAGQTYAFYLVTDTDGKLFNGCCDSATSAASDATMSWISRYESHGLFSVTYLGWPFQGAVCYNGGDCGAAAPVAATEIPTLSEWGMILLSLLVAGFAAAHLYRRNRGMAA